MSLSYMLKVVLGCTHTRPSGRGRWPFSHLTVLKWPHCSLACTHTRSSGRGRWLSQLWPGHGRLLYIRHHVVTRHHQASAAWTIIKSAASQSFNNNGQQHREHSSHFAESVAYRLPKWLTDTRLLYGTNVNQQLNRLTPCLPFNGKEGSSPLLCPWSSHGLYVIQLRLRSRACARVGSLASVPWRPVPLQHTSPWPDWPHSHWQI